MSDINIPEGSTLDDGGKYDAGHGMRFTPYYTDRELTQLEGIWFWHPCTQERGPMPGPNGRTGQQWGYSNTDDPEHLTLTGSILCQTCQFHGFLVDGKWEPCS